MSGIAITPPRTEPASAAFAADEALLTGVLREVIAIGDGEQAVALLDEAIELGRRARDGEADAADRLAELVAGLDLARTEVLVRALTRWFQLINLAEDNERVRRLAERDAAAAADGSGAPREGSLRAVVAGMRAAGASGDEVVQILGHAR